MRETVVPKQTIDVVRALGRNNLDVHNPTLQELAKRTLAGYRAGAWNSSYITFIELNYTDILSISNGKRTKYKIAEIFRNSETEGMEIVEVAE